MKNLFLAVAAVLMTIFSVNAQQRSTQSNQQSNQQSSHQRIVSPHPDLEIQIKSCDYSKGTVELDLVLTNKGAEETVTFYGTNAGSAAYDNEANQYAKGSSKITTGPTGGKVSNTTKIVLPRNIPVKYRVEIDKVSTTASSFKLLKLYVSSTGRMSLSKTEPIEIYNISWGK